MDIWSRSRSQCRSIYFSPFCAQSSECRPPRCSEWKRQTGWSLPFATQSKPLGGWVAHSCLLDGRTYPWSSERRPWPRSWGLTSLKNLWSGDQPSSLRAPASVQTPSASPSKWWTKSVFRWSQWPSSSSSLRHYTHLWLLQRPHVITSAQHAAGAEGSMWEKCHCTCQHVAA